ncbi:MAG: hypothetical protein ACRDT2_10205, partial [Natronosporangium sp.]
MSRRGRTGGPPTTRRAALAARLAFAAAVLTGLAAVATAAVGTALAAPPARAAAAQVDVFVEVNPSTIQAGFQVGIRASCGEDLNPASVKSGAFGELTLTPQQGSRLMLGQGTVPSTTRAGEYKVDLRCANGATATAELFVLDMAQPTRGPKTGGGGTAGGGLGAAGPVLLAGAGA